MSYIDDRRNMKIFGKPSPEKKTYTIAKQSEKKKKQIAEQKESGENKSDTWFLDRRKEMTGFCLLCGEKTEKHNDSTYRNSIAHLFAKRKTAFPSIATHPVNFIELCFFGNSCHTNYDNRIITFEYIKKEYPNAWKVIIEKTEILYPLMTKEEQKRVPEIIIREITQGNYISIDPK